MAGEYSLQVAITRFEIFDIVVKTEIGHRRIAKVKFASDGGIYVFSPGFVRADGIACKAVVRAGAGITSSLDLTENGKVTSHLMKYSHHKDGEAHFSQDGKVFTYIRRKSVPLESQRGHLFTIQLQKADSFPLLQSPRKKQLTLMQPSEDGALKISAWRFHIEDLGIPDNVTASMRPGGLQTSDGKMRQGLFVAPPIGTPFDDMALFLAFEEIPWLNEERDSQLIFLGAFDPPELALNHSRDTEFIVFAYPCSDFDKLKQRIGSIDFMQNLVAP